MGNGGRIWTWLLLPASGIVLPVRHSHFFGFHGFARMKAGKVGDNHALSLIQAVDYFDKAWRFHPQMQRPFFDMALLVDHKRKGGRLTSIHSLDGNRQSIAAALNVERDIGIHSWGQFSILVVEIDFDLTRTRGQVQFPGGSNNLSCELLAGSLNMNLGRVANVHISRKVFGNW